MTNGWPHNGYLITKQPSLGRVAVVAFYANCDGDPKHMKCYRNRHAHHLLSEYDGQPPALLQCSSALAGNAILSLIWNVFK